MDTNDDQAEIVGREQRPTMERARHGHALGALLLVLGRMVFGAQDTSAAVRPSFSAGGAGSRVALRPMVDRVMPRWPDCPTTATGVTAPQGHCVAVVDSASRPTALTGAPAATSGLQHVPIMMLVLALFVALQAEEFDVCVGKLLGIVAPPGDFEGFVEEVGQAVSLAEPPMPPARPPDAEVIQWIVAAGARHYLEISPPPAPGE